MKTYHKINAPFKRDMDGSITGVKGKLMVGEWARPEYEYLADNQWEFTEKVDGTNIRIGYDPYLHPDDQVQFAGRSDNAVLPKPLVEYLEATFKAYPYDVFGIDQPPRVVLFGEGYGPKIQGGGKYRDDHSFVLFDVKIGDFWLDRDNVNDIAEKLEIDAVPVIGTGTLWQAINFVKYGTPYLPEEVRNIQMMIERDGGEDWLSKLGGMKSQWGDFEAEGIVARPTVPLFDRMGNRVITKIKAKDFK